MWQITYAGFFRHIFGQVKQVEVLVQVGQFSRGFLYELDKL